MPELIIRITKLKTKQDIQSAAAHDQRKGQTDNADPARTKLNRYLIGKNDDDVYGLVIERIGEQRIRLNAVLSFEVMITATHSYFNPENPSSYGQYDEERLNAFEKVALNFLKKKFGDNIILCVIHVDEATPHIHAIIVPLVGDNNKLSFEQIFGGKKDVMSKFQTEAHIEFAHLGLTRGKIGSSAKHIEIQEIYELALEPIRALPTWNMNPPAPPRQKPKEPALSSLFGGKKAIYEEELKQWEEENKYREKYYLELEIFNEEQTKAVKPYLARAGKVNVLEKMVEDLKDSNSKLTRQIQSLSPDQHLHKETPPQNILKIIYGAENISSSSTQNKIPTFKLNERVFYIKKDTWTESATQHTGRGAISLVSHLEELRPERALDAVPIIASHFGIKQATTDLCCHYLKNAEEDAKWIAAQPYPLPKIDPKKTENAKIFLVETCKIPEKIAIESIESGLVFVDTLDNLVFPRPSGGFTRQSMKLNRNGNQVNRKEQLHDPEPFFIKSKAPGDQELIVALDELEALALMAQFPNAQIIVLRRCSYSKCSKRLRSANKLILSFDLNQESGIDKDILYAFSENGILSDVVTFRLPSDILSGCNSWINLLRKNTCEKIKLNSEISVFDEKPKGHTGNKFGPGM